MNSSFEKYIKAAMDSHKYDVVCEMANVIYPEKNKINIMQYPGNDVRVYKNREDEVQVLCPRNISYVQESNLTKAISTGTIFEDADEVDKYAGFIVKTKMPIDAMTNKGLENPYKMQEIAGATMGVMGEDGDVEISDVDVQNGRNVIDDLLDKDSKEFKDVKNVVDDYLDNDEHEYGYDRDFTVDIQQLRDEIQQFKDSDISPEDSITDMDWDDNWGSATSIMGDHNDAEDEKDDNDDDHDIDVSDDDDEDDMSFEEYSIMMESGDMFVQEGAITTLKQIGYNPLTKTFITDIPAKDGKPGEKMRCKIKIGGIVAAVNGACFQYDPIVHPEPTIHIPLKDLLGDPKRIISLLKHEEGHLYVSLDRGHFDEDFARAEKLVNKVGHRLPDHEKSREEYVADLYAANTAGAENMIKTLKQFGFENRRNAKAIKQKINSKRIHQYLKKISLISRHMEQIKSNEDLSKILQNYVATYDIINDTYKAMRVWNGDPIKKMAEAIAAGFKGYMDTEKREYSMNANAKDDFHRKGISFDLKLACKKVSDQADLFDKINAECKKEIEEINNECKQKLARIRKDIEGHEEHKRLIYDMLDNANLSSERRSELKNSLVNDDNESIERLNSERKSRLAGRKHSIDQALNKRAEAISDAIPFLKKVAALEKKIINNIQAVYKVIDESVKIADEGIKARIYFIRKYANKPKTESTTYRLRDPFFTESYNNTLIDYKITEESGVGCMSCNPSGGGNVNKTINEETEPVVPGDPNTVPKPVMSSGSDIQESDSPVETPSVPPPPTNTTAGEPAGDKKMKPEDPDDLNSSPDTSNNHAPVMTAVKMESFHQEFSIKRPKHLKAIDVRSIVAYVTVEMNAIKDSNDQAMLAGYVCSKLELIDFYITVLDTHDDRYVVPHSRQYLADGQRQLSDLLTKILKIRPIDKSERIWKAIVS